VRRLALGALALALALAATTTAVAAPALAIAEAEAALDAFHAALAAGDRDAALARLDPAVVIFEAGGAELSREEYASHHLAGDMEYLAATATERVDRRSGASGELVWVLTRSKTSGTFQGKEVSSRGTETALLARRGNGWKIVHLHWSSRAAKR
jgi:ketosteroid isomerase-like protein